MINLLQNLPQVDLGQTLRQSLPTAERISQWDNIGRQNAMRGMLSDYANNPNAKADDYLAIAQQYPELVDQFKPAWQGLDEQEKKQKQSFLSQLNMSMAGGDQEQALQLIDDQMKTYQDRNDTEEVGGLTSLKDLIQKNPGQATTSLGMALYSGLTPQQIEEHQNKLNEIKAKTLQAQASASKSKSDQQINEAKFPTDMKKSQAQAQLYEAQAGRAATETQYLPEDYAIRRGNLDVALQNAETNSANLLLSKKRLEQGSVTDAQKKPQRLLQESADNLESRAFEFGNYLDELKNAPAGMDAGAKGRLASWYNNFAGTQDAFEAQRILINKLGVAELLKSAQELKPVSDSDLNIIATGIPDRYANKDTQIKYFSAVKKVMDHKILTDRFLAEFLSKNNYQQSASKEDIQVPLLVGDRESMVTVPKGTSYGKVRLIARQEAAKIIKGQAEGQPAQQPSQGAPVRPPLPPLLQGFMQRRGQ